eukprot:1159602-Pelagomonas_calceolata.AAC.2
MQQQEQEMKLIMAEAARADAPVSDLGATAHGASDTPSSSVGPGRLFLVQLQLMQTELVALDQHKDSEEVMFTDFREEVGQSDWQLERPREGPAINSKDSLCLDG